MTRAARGRFAPGSSGNLRGRPKDQHQVRALARKATPQAVNQLRRILDDKRAPKGIKAKAALALLAIGRTLRREAFAVDPDISEPASRSERNDSVTLASEMAVRPDAFVERIHSAFGVPVRMPATQLLDAPAKTPVSVEDPAPPLEESRTAGQGAHINLAEQGGRFVRSRRRWGSQFRVVMGRK